MPLNPSYLGVAPGVACATQSHFPEHAPASHTLQPDDSMRTKWQDRAGPSVASAHGASFRHLALALAASSHTDLI